MKNKILVTFLPVLIILLIFSITIQVRATVTWQEDFDGETIPTLVDWDFQAWETNGGIYNPLIDHGFSVIDDILRAPYYPSWNLTNGTLSKAIHNSTIAYGTWSFDWLPTIAATEQDEWDGIYFIFNGAHQDLTGLPFANNSGTGYGITVWHNTDGEGWQIKLDKQLGPPPTVTTLGYHYIIPPVNESIYIKVTRDDEGLFKVYYDNLKAIEVTDNDITTSQEFLFSSAVGNTGIDNIVINDAIASVGVPAVPASTIGFVICTATSTIIVIVLVRKRIIFKNRYRNVD
jgi:hypothetical protein